MNDARHIWTHAGRIVSTYVSYLIMIKASKTKVLNNAMTMGAGSPTDDCTVRAAHRATIYPK